MEKYVIANANKLQHLPGRMFNALDDAIAQANEDHFVDLVDDIFKKLGSNTFVNFTRRKITDEQSFRKQIVASMKDEELESFFRELGESKSAKVLEPLLNSVLEGMNNEESDECREEVAELPSNSKLPAGKAKRKIDAASPTSSESSVRRTRTKVDLTKELFATFGEL